MALVRTQLGWIEVICGSMFSGKSEELIRRLRRAIIAKQRVQIFKPTIDSRSDAEIVSHSDMRMPSISVGSSAELTDKVDHRTEVVGVDEAQFFDDGLIEAAQRLADQGKRVIIAGLDKDFRGMPFGPIPSLMAVAEEVTKTLAICVRCGSPANNTQRLVESDELVVVGAQGVYEARCRRCFEPPSRI
ncbi:MAG TPA: thymidine kinase [Thermoanaerobaculia bacterium]|nr:thymidine kinase [Thermoanaerobaculia bacterium]HEV8609563.1 thymidine kinase [Thermoanaerobaculia bacterium]